MGELRLELAHRLQSFPYLAVSLANQALVVGLVSLHHIEHSLLLFEPELLVLDLLDDFIQGIVKLIWCQRVKLAH